MTRLSRREIEQLLSDLEPDTAGSGGLDTLSGDSLDMAVDVMMDAYAAASAEEQAQVDELLDQAVEQTEGDTDDPVSELGEIGRLLLIA